MSVRRLAAALALGTLAVTAAPASATCYIAGQDICNKPTDRYTDPVVRLVVCAFDPPPAAC
jgi:hypothetical protein